MSFKEKVKECHSLREKIKQLEDKMQDVKMRGEEIKERLMNDPGYKAVFEEYKNLSDEHSKTISDFAQKNDALLNEFGGENV